MKLQTGLLALITFLATIPMPLPLNLKRPLSTPQTLAQAPDARKSEADKLMEQGKKQFATSQFQAASQSFQQARTLYQKMKDNQGEGNALKNLGNAVLFQGNYAKAIDYQQQSLVFAQQIQDQQLVAQALNGLGMAYFSLGDLSKAINYYQQSLTIAKKIGDRRAQGKALGNLGVAYNVIGDLTRAIEYQQQRLAITRELGDLLGEGQCLGNLGIAYNDLGNYPKAIEYQQQRLKIAREIKDHLGEGQSLSNLGDAYDRIGDLTRAIDSYQESLAIARELGNRPQESNSLNGLGIIYDSLGDYTKAIEYFKQSLAINRQFGVPFEDGNTLNNLGRVLFLSGNLAKATQTLLAAIKVYESRRKGLDDLQKVSIFETQIDSAYTTLQQVLIAQNNTNASLEISERGRAQAFVELLAKRVSNSSLQPTDSRYTIGLIQQIAKNQNATLVEYSIIRNLFRIQKRLELREAELFIWIVKPTGEVAFRRVDLKPLWQQKDTSLTKLAPNSPIVIPAAPNSPDAVTPIAESEQELTRPWQQPIAIALIILTTGSIIGIAIWSGRLFLTKKAAQNSKLKQHWLVPSLLLIFAVSSGGGLWFWMTRSQAIAQNPNLRNNSLLAELVDSTRESIKTKGRGLGIVSLGQKASQGDRLKQLHQILIQPIADLLPTDPNARVIFIPQSSLFLVPFPALQDESGKYLIEKHTILTAPSIQVLSLTHQQRQRVGAIHQLPLQGKDALIVGNPTMPKVPPQIGETPQQLPSLPGAEEEAKSIAALLKTQVLTGEQATKKAVLQKMSTARIVHLATHGILDERQVLNSAIALAPDPPPYKEQIGEINGLLTAEQIFGLKLNAELVVLSACDTGKGRITGDGVVGLSRSLISAGVPSVIVSLWSVPDAPTAELMTQFYRNLLLNPDKAQALRGAMLATMKKHPNPIDWAAFTLIGEAN